MFSIRSSLYSLEALQIVNTLAGKPKGGRHDREDQKIDPHQTLFNLVDYLYNLLQNCSCSTHFFFPLGSLSLLQMESF